MLPNRIPPTKITREQAEEVWKILVEEVGVSPNDDSMKYSFMHYFTQEDGDFKEFRICGSLGFGGKIKFNLGQLYVSFYTEDFTHARNKASLAANKRLSQIKL